tara:strand:+ start:1784 stop:2368 length:585 start_codon:yes stop_codon:yes gene_type:complete
MRIIAGDFKGIGLFLPKDKKIRPLKDMVRENIFNFLTHSNEISFSLEQSNVLDLYSGTGSFGLECISRKAEKVVFVEKEKEAEKILQKNIEKLKVKGKTEIFSDDVFNFIKNHDRIFLESSDKMKFDFIFCDPPFKDTNINILIELIIKNSLLKKNGIIILHRHKNSEEKLAAYIKVIDKRIYGLSKIIFGKTL